MLLGVASLHIYSYFKNYYNYLPRSEFSLKAFPHPRDINWSHIGQPKTEETARKVLFTLLMILVLIFLSTPAAMYEMIRRNSVVESISNKTKEWPPIIQYLAFTYFPPICILLINNILTSMIFLLSKQTPTEMITTTPTNLPSPS